MNPKIFTALIAIFGTGLIGGYLLHDFFLSQSKDRLIEAVNTSKQVRQMGNYTYINPLLECEVAQGVIDERKENFHGDLEGFVVGLKKRLQLSDVAIYFRDMNNGPTFGVNEEGKFFPASLLKVPLMMVYYQLIEQDPGLLEIKIPYLEPRDFGYVQSIEPEEKLVIGQQYTIDELLYRMIVYSDNQALYLLSSRIPKQRYDDLFSMLGVNEEVLVNPEEKLTVKEYSGFFRILFNASYLSSEYSEKALTLLASADFSEGLVAGVPPGISVAHKFGEAGTENTERQLHDCGIVYFPNHPYLACIMTRGNKLENLKQAIREISGFIYDKIDEQY